MKHPMLHSLLLTILLLPAVSEADDILTCEQQTDLCELQCHTTHMGDEKGLGTCKAKCFGKWTSCSIFSGTDKVKDATETVVDDATEKGASLAEKAKAFWEGLTE